MHIELDRQGRTAADAFFKGIYTMQADDKTFYVDLRGLFYTDVTGELSTRKSHRCLHSGDPFLSPVVFAPQIEIREVHSATEKLFVFSPEN